MNTTLWLIGLSITASPLVYLLGRINTRFDKPAFAGRWLALITLTVMSLWFSAVAQNLMTQETVQIETIGAITFRFDGISLLLVALVLLLSFGVTIYSFPYFNGRTGEEKYYAAVIMMTGAMIGLVCAADLFNLWIWFELMTISSYLLVTFDHEHPASLEAGIKYLVQSALGSSLILFGIAVVIAQTGSTLIAPDVLTQPLAAALLIAGFGVKIALVPLHTWLPDAHSQAPSGISALLSGVVIEVALIALLRALSMFTLSAGMLLMAFGVINMVSGNLLALPQKQIKRMLAYSSLSHMGYILLGLGIALYAGESNGAQAGFFHLFNHGLMKGLAFLAAGSLLYTLHGHSGKPLLIDELSGAARRYPLAALTLTLALLGLGGLPPLAGFMSKWQIFVAGFETQNAAIQLLILFAALNSVLSLGYYAPVINRLYRQEMSAEVVNGQPVPVLMVIPLVLLALAVVILGFVPDLMAEFTQTAGAALMTAFGG